MKRSKKICWVILTLLLVFQTVAVYATESLSITQIVQDELKANVYAQLVNIENDSVVNATINKDDFSIKLNAGQAINPTSMQLFSNTQEGVSYVVIIDQNSKLINSTSVRAKYKKALTELRNAFGEKDYVKLIAAGKTAKSIFAGNENGFSNDFSKFDAAIADIKNSNVTTRPSLLDAMKLAMESYLSKTRYLPKRQVIIVFTIGTDGSSYQPDEIVELAEKSCVPIYVVGIDSNESKASLDDMGRIARASFGHLFTPVEYSQPSEAVTRIISWVRNTYVLEFEPSYAAFGNDNLKWTLNLSTESRVIDSHSYSRALTAVVTPTPIVTATPTVTATVTPTPRPTATPTAKPIVTPSPTPIPKNKLLTFVTSPLGISLLASVFVLIVAIVFLLVRNKRMMALEEFDDNNSNDQDIHMQTNVSSNDDSTIAPINSNQDMTSDIFGDGEQTMPVAGITVRFIVEYDGLTDEYVKIILKSLQIGRGTDKGMVLKDPSVSRSHCRIDYIDDCLYIMDDGSRSGTRVNGTRITEKAALKQGDRIQVGNTFISIALISPR